MNLECFSIKMFPKHYSQNCRSEEISPKVTWEMAANRWKVAKNGHLYDWLLPQQQYLMQACDDDIDDLWGNIKDAFTKTGEETLG